MVGKFVVSSTKIGILAQACRCKSSLNYRHLYVEDHSMPNHVRHFAVHADDVDRARHFYQEVFGWRFEPWGPPNFYLIRTGPDDDRGLQGALQQRHEALGGSGMRGFECTIGVDDLGVALGTGWG
jgi:predicted enzyme related to lactoylglutathione lyase